GGCRSSTGWALGLRRGRERLHWMGLTGGRLVRGRGLVCGVGDVRTHPRDARAPGDCRAMTQTEALLGGVRWRLTLHDDRTFAVARHRPDGWDTLLDGTGALEQVRDTADILRDPDRMLIAEVNPDVLSRLADLAEAAHKEMT